MRWVPTQVSIILLPSTPRGVSALMEINNSYMPASKEDSETTNLWLFPERLHPAGFVEALPATSEPTTPTRYYSAGDQHHQVVQHSNIAFQQPQVPSTKPRGSQLSVCGLGAVGPSPQHQAEMPAAQRVMKEPRSWHATPAEAPGGRTGQTQAANLRGGSREIHHSSWVRLLSGEDAHWDCKSPGFISLYLHYFFSSGNLFQGEDILSLSYKSYSIVQHPEFKVSGQEEKLHITL